MDLDLIVMNEVPGFYATHYIIHKSRMNKETVMIFVRDNLSDICFTVVDYPEMWMMVMDDSVATEERWLIALSTVNVVT